MCQWVKGPAILNLTRPCSPDANPGWACGTCVRLVRAQWLRALPGLRCASLGLQDPIDHNENCCGGAARACSGRVVKQGYWLITLIDQATSKCACG